MGCRRRPRGYATEGGMAMTTTTHTRSVHIDAPVEQVFEHVKDPENYFAAMREADPGMSAQITKVPAELGVDSTWEWSGRLFFVPIHAAVTRTEYVPNQRIVDHQPGAVASTVTHTTQPDGTGTTLTMRRDVSSRVPLLDKVEEKARWNGDEDLDKCLAAYKKAIEG